MAATTTTLSETDLTRISCDAAESFTDAYYTALSASPAQLSSFYTPPTTSPHTLPHISYNGEVLNDGALLQARFVSSHDNPFVHYEAQCTNVHVLNRSLRRLGERASKREMERNVSLVVSVSGYVRLFERKDGEMRGFSDNFVLVPGPGAEGKAGEGRQWVIQTQNFRFVT